MERGTAKETIHLELSLDGSGLNYETGDALAVLPVNAADVVEQVLASAGLAGDEKVTLKDSGEIELKEALTSYLDITALSRAVVKKYQALSPMIRSSRSYSPMTRRKTSKTGSGVVRLSIYLKNIR